MGAKYYDDYVCLLTQLKNYMADFHQIFVHVTCSHGLVLLL